MTLQPRLLADYAAVPTRRERAAARAHWRDAQRGMFDTDDDDRPSACAACGSVNHPSTACQHGTALTLPIEPEHQADEHAPPLPGGNDRSVQVDACRLTDADRAAIADAVTVFAAATRTMGTGERFTTAERIAHRAIGCDERDLRDSEILAIRQLFKPILAAHLAQ